jgi:chondroitin sulfate N-acetylgalactosaminyltransferase 1/2
MKISYATLLLFSAITVSVVLVIAYAIMTFKPWQQMTKLAKKQPLFMTSRMLDPCNRPLQNVTLVKLQDIKHKLEIEDLRRKVAQLKEKLNATVARIDALEKNAMSCQEKEDMDGKGSCEVDPFTKSIVDEMKKGAMEQLSEGEIVRLSAPQTAFNEHEELRWESFTFKHIYRYQEGINLNPKQTQRREYREVISEAVKSLNEEKNTSQPVVTSEELVDGLSLFSRTRGRLYRLYFPTADAHIYRLAEYFRPFGHVRQLKEPNTVDVSDVWIHMILTLRERTDRFKTFLKMYVDVCVKNDKKVFLTVVYFGKKGQDEAKNILRDMASKSNYKNYSFLTINSTFSRGRGLQYGAEQLGKENVLMFFCDVDIHFNREFLDRCRIHAQPGKVYFPIVFSLYNPDVVYGEGRGPSKQSQLVIRHQTGTWRKYGYGMSCLYKNDFLSVGGFDLSIEGWGNEDVDLLKRFKCSSVEIVRAVDRGIFHLYHEKVCDSGMSEETFSHCVTNKAIYEASHRQLGLIVFNLTEVK